MAVGSDQRREERRPIVAAMVPEPDLEAALDLFAIADLAWHDCYGPRDLAVPPGVVDDILLLCEGSLRRLVRLALSATWDFRDVRMAADSKRSARS